MRAFRTAPPGTCGLNQVRVSNSIINLTFDHCSRHVFEKSLILKQLSMTGQCPITGQNLDATADLITLQVASHTAPKPMETMSFPGMLKFMQDQWDTQMLEVY